MRASALKYAILSIMTNVAVVIFCFMPLYGFLTVWGAHLFGGYTFIRLVAEILLAVCVLCMLYLMVTDQKIRGHTLSRRLVWIILLFSGVTVVWGIIAQVADLVNLKALCYGLIVDLRPLAFFLVTWAIAVRTNRLRAPWLRLVLIPAAIVVVFGLLQVFVLPRDFLSHFGYGPNTIPVFETINHNVQYVRIASTLRGANPLGAYLIVPLSILAVLWSRGHREWYYVLLFLGGVVVLYFSFSRSAWIGALISLAIIVFAALRKNQQKERALYVFGALLIIVGCLLFGLRNNPHIQNVFYHTQTHSAVATTSDGGHATALKSGIHDIIHDPLGRGPGSAGPASVYNNHPARIAENFYIQIGQEVGILGLALYLLISLGIGYLLWLRRDDPLAYAMFASFVGLTFVNLLSHAWADDTLAYIWWGYAGIAMAPYDKAKDKI
jgi:hypothetical protein